MLHFAFRNLWRQPLRTGLALAGLAAATAVMVCLSAFGEGYRHALRTELDGMGVQLMLVPLGCPYDAAARVVKGRPLEFSLPAAALPAVRNDPAVAVAAPLLIVESALAGGLRADRWVGLDRSALALKPWWRATQGAAWFAGTNSVILGSEVAAAELRQPGDPFTSPGAGRVLRVDGILERSGTTDDNLLFTPLETAQSMFGQTGRLTSIAIRLHDPADLAQASRRLQSVPGAQVVTMTEVLGTFLNLVGMVRRLLLAVAIVALTAGGLGMFNTLLAAVVERSQELSLLRAVGASRTQVFGLITAESIALATLGSVAGLCLAALFGPWVEQAIRQSVPLAPSRALLSLSVPVVAQAFLAALCVGLVAGSVPAWRAARLEPAAAARME